MPDSQLYNKQYDHDHMIQRLYVHWDVSTQCNFACTYCYAMKHYGDDWGKIDTWARQKLIIYALSQSSLPIFLGLLGGEPTMHPQYYELIDLCHKAVSKHERGRMYVTTNGSASRDWFREHPYYDNMYFLWSAHFEYEGKYGKDFDLILDNIRIMKEKGFRSKVNVMLSPRPKLWPKIHKFVDELEAIGGLEIHPHFVYNGNVHELYKYPRAFYDEFKRFESYPKPFVFEGPHGKDTFNEYTLFDNSMTKFTGWTCWNNNYEILWNGKLSRFCNGERYDLINNPHFFRNLTEVQPMTCPHSSCNCDGLLKIYKEKPGEADIR